MIRSLADICGAGFARPAGAADEVAGEPATWVAAPGTVAAVSEVLRLAAEHELSVVPRGAGTKLDWGMSPARVDLVLDTGRLAGLRHHPTDQLVAEVGAGTPIRAVHTMLERGGRRLPLDVASSGGTIGGVLAADEAGPLRHRYGGAADQLLDLTYVDATGVPVRVVAGTGGALGEERLRALCGSQGALGVLVSATLRLHPIPVRRLWVTRSVWTPLEVHDLVGEVLTAGLRPAAVEVDLPAVPGVPVVRQRPRPPVAARHPAGTARRPGVGPLAGSGSLSVLIEGAPTDTTERAARLVSLLGGDAQPLSAPPPWWRSYPFGPGDVALRIDVPVGDLHAAIYALRDAAGGPVPVRGSAGLGTVYAALPGGIPPERAAVILTAVRGVLLARGGRCLVLAAPPHIRRAVDIWGGLPDLTRWRRVKQRFDPTHRLAPGRFVGGI